MRVLFSCQIGYGVFHPLVPLARALVGEGHEVAFATGEHFCPWVEQVGFTAFPAGLHRDAYIDEVKRQHPEFPSGIPREQLLAFHLAVECAGHAAPAKVGDLVRIIEGWLPDVVVHDATDFAAPVAASVTSLPYASHGWTTLFPMELWRRAAEAVTPLWEQWAVEPGPLGGFFRHLYFDVFPRRLEGSHVDELPVVRRLRPVPFHVPLDGTLDAHSLSPWLDSRTSRPMVYVTLGTIFNKNTVLVTTILEALREAPLDLVLAVGNDVDPESFGPQPDNVFLASYVPQSEVLARCDAVVCHGGAGSVLASAVHGLPLLVLPQGIDQFLNARRCEAAGMGRCLVPAALSVEAVHRDIRLLLDDPSYRTAARQVQQEIEAMPDPSTGVAVLEELVQAGAVVGMVS